MPCLWQDVSEKIQDAQKSRYLSLRLVASDEAEDHVVEFRRPRQIEKMSAFFEYLQLRSGNGGRKLLRKIKRCAVIVPGDGHQNGNLNPAEAAQLIVRHDAIDALRRHLVGGSGADPFVFVFYDGLVVFVEGSIEESLVYASIPNATSTFLRMANCRSKK